MLLIDFSDQQPTKFICSPGRNFREPGVRSQFLRILKIYAVFALVLGAFIRVVFKDHGVSLPNGQYS